MGRLETLQTQTIGTVGGLTYDVAGDMTEDELFDLAIKQLGEQPKHRGCLTIASYRERLSERIGEPVGRSKAIGDLNRLVTESGWKKKKTGRGWIYWYDGERGGDPIGIGDSGGSG